MILLHYYKRFEFWFLRKIGLIKFGKIGKLSRIKYGFFGAPEKIFIGDYVYSGENCNFWGEGGLEIGSGTIFGPNVIIRTTNHDYKTGDFIPFGPGVEYKKVIIGENCWFGGNVLVAPGTTVGEGCIIGFGAVISGNIPPYSVVVGNPGKVIKQRNIEKYNNLKEDKKIYLKHFKE